MKRAAKKIVSKLHNFEQKQRHVDIAQEMLTMFWTFEIRSRFAQKGHNWWRIIGVWQWYWNQSPIIPMEASRRAKTEKSTSSWGSNVKVLLTVFFECNGVVHHEFLPQVPKVNKKCYFELMWQLSAFVRNAQNCLKNQSCLDKSFWPKTKP